jgi:hypothetical protein
MINHFNHIRMKIYILIILLGFMFGWIDARKVNIHFDGAITRYDETFNYEIFSLVLMIGFGIVFLYDFYIYFRRR